MIEVPNSSGTSIPRYKAPADACDSHIHIYDPRFTMKWPNLRAVTDASVAEYRLLQKRLGTSRAVVVQPAAYGTDNAVTLDAIAQLGPAKTRGIAVVHPTVTDTELVAMNKGGIRGLRFTLHEPRTAVTSAEMIEPLAHRAHRLGWHVQLHLRAEQIVEMAPLIELPGHHRLRPHGAPAAAGGLAPSRVRHREEADRQGQHVGEALRPLPRHEDRPAALRRPEARSRAPSSSTRRSAACGAATGRIRPSRTASPTTRCSSISCRSGRSTRPRARRSW